MIQSILRLENFDASLLSGKRLPPFVMQETNWMTHVFPLQSLVPTLSFIADMLLLFCLLLVFVFVCVVYNAVMFL